MYCARSNPARLIGLPESFITGARPETGAAEPLLRDALQTGPQLQRRFTTLTMGSLRQWRND